ncbi:MAG: response regulator, partial [Deltaproteobacteria bacterium]
MSDHPIRVLVADDNVDFLENIREILEEEGYTVFVATDGMEA